MLHTARVAFTSLFLDYYSAFRLYFTVLFTLETLVLCLLTVAALSFYIKYYEFEGHPLTARRDTSFLVQPSLTLFFWGLCAFQANLNWTVRVCCCTR